MFQCSSCSQTFPKWHGQCPACGAWNSLSEIAQETRFSAKKKSHTSLTPKTINEKGASISFSRVQLESAELNNALGGGMTQGSFLLLSGEPGIGKSTISLQIADWFSSGSKKTSMYISGEESSDQVMHRAERLGIKNTNILFFSSQEINEILSLLETKKTDLVIIDSVSVLYSEELPGSLGSVQQIRTIAEKCMAFAKRTGTTVVLIGHVTKDGDLAGPKTLEHLVDTVLFLEGSKNEDYRILRVLKNRFGPTDEVALFQMTEKGLIDLENPGTEFTKNHRKSIGSALGITLEGTRPLVIEIEALTSYTKFGYPKRTTNGISSGRLDLILAVLGKFGKLTFDEWDAYVAIARGLRITETSIDLAVAAALISSRLDIPLENTLFLGEISLTGRIKTASSLEKRLDELDRLGFTHALLSKEAAEKVQNKKRKNLTITGISDIGELVAWIKKGQ